MSEDIERSVPMLLDGDRWWPPLLVSAGCIFDLLAGGNGEVISASSSGSPQVSPALAEQPLWNIFLQSVHVNREERKRVGEGWVEWERGSRVEWERGSRVEWERGSRVEWERGSRVEWERGSRVEWESYKLTFTFHEVLC